jgi:predicted nucleic-acid-binding protein
VKGLDTNVLVRYLTWDHRAQSARAAEVMEAAAQGGDPLFISPLVMCELVWVLETAYGYERDEVLDTLESLLRAAQLEFGEKDVLWLALGDARRDAGDFSDYVMGRRAASAGCDLTYTFDQGLTNSTLFKVL